MSFIRIFFTILVTIDERWLIQHLVLAYMFIKNNESIIATQQIFHQNFNIDMNESVQTITSC